MILPLTYSQRFSVSTMRIYVATQFIRKKELSNLLIKQNPNQLNSNHMDMSFYIKWTLIIAWNVTMFNGKGAIYLLSCVNWDKMGQKTLMEMIFDNLITNTIVLSSLYVYERTCTNVIKRYVRVYWKFAFIVKLSAINRIITKSDQSVLKNLLKKTPIPANYIIVRSSNIDIAIDIDRCQFF